MYDFSETNPKQVIDLLPLVQEAMDEFQDSPNVDWLPEQLYGMLFLGLANLTIILKDNLPIGFVIYRWLTHQLNNQRYIHIWLFYIFKENRGNLKEVVEVSIDYFSNMCKLNGGTFIEIPTTRAGWEKQLKGKMELSLLTFRKRV